ncbi:MAG TPA: Fe-Mn family superoxide dismutase [Burkholderiaceae bacterium]
MNYQMQPLTCEPAKLTGLSEKLIGSHYENNYGGAVKRLNAIRAQLAQLVFSTTAGFTINGLKREELVATNSMLLHELYFDSLGGDGKLPPPMTLALAASFGSVERWRDEFVAIGKALGGGSGWVMLSYLPRDGRLVNQWASDHTQCVALGTPILALDMYEHAYHIDYGSNAAAYVDCFMQNIDWSKVNLRYAQAVHGASEGMGASEESAASAFVVDVRRAGIFSNAETMIPNAQWHDPENIDQWMHALPRDQKILVYCIHGHEVSRNCAIRLSANGFDARFLKGGLEAWQSSGYPLASKGKSL